MFISIGFTTCDTASLLANDKHLTSWCGSDVCSGRWVTGVRMKSGSQVSIRRTTDNRIEAVVSDASGGTSTEFWNMDVAADVPVRPVVDRTAREGKALKFSRMRQDCGAVRSQIDHKIHVLENAVREQRELISSLQDQVELMKVGSPPVACHDSDFSSCSWLSNDFVSVNDSVIQRIGDIDQKNYSFRSTTFATGTTITFVISGVAKQFGESLTFGVTVYSPDQLDMQSLPANGLKLQISCSSNFWFIANDFLSDPKAQQVVCLKRTSVGVVMETESEERLLFSVDPHVRLFPFFLFDGYVQAIQLKEFKVHDRTGLECVTCLEKVASTRAKPCGHILYCSDCREGATLTIGNKCPVCKKDIVKYKQVPIV